MTRFTNSANQVAAEKRHVVGRTLVDLDFSSGHVRVHDGLGDLIYNGNTFKGVGTLGEISDINESTDLKPFDPVTLTLAGVDPSVIANVQNEEYYGRNATIFVALFDATTLQLIEPLENALYEGLMDTMLIKRDDDQAVITLTVVSHLAAWEDSIGTLWTDEHQQAIYPGDLGCDRVTTMASQVLKWMNQKVKYYGPHGSYSNATPV